MPFLGPYIYFQACRHVALSPGSHELAQCVVSEQTRTPKPIHKTCCTIEAPLSDALPASFPRLCLLFAAALSTHKRHSLLPKRLPTTCDRLFYLHNSPNNFLQVFLCYSLAHMTMTVGPDTIPSSSALMGWHTTSPAIQRQPAD